MTLELQKNEQVNSSFLQPRTAKSLEGATILVAEDDLINQKILSRFLERWNLSVIIAKDGGQAIAELKANAVNLVLMDLQMPQMNGYEATRIIRSLGHHQKSNIPIIALTASALKEVEDKVLATGMDDYLSKPFKPDELKKKLEYHILKRPANGRA